MKKKKKYPAGALLGALGGKAGALAGAKGSAAAGKAAGASGKGGGAIGKGGGMSPFTKMSSIFGTVGDVANLWATTQGDEKASKIGTTFNNLAGGVGIVGKEQDKKIEGAAKVVMGAKTGNANMVAEGVGQAKNKGTTLDEVGRKPVSTGNPDSDKYSMSPEDFYAQYGYHPGEIRARRGIRFKNSYKNKNNGTTKNKTKR